MGLTHCIIPLLVNKDAFHMWSCGRFGSRTDGQSGGRTRTRRRDLVDLPTTRCHRHAAAIQSRRKSYAARRNSALPRNDVENSSVWNGQLHARWLQNLRWTLSGLVADRKRLKTPTSSVLVKPWCHPSRRITPTLRQI